MENELLTRVSPENEWDVHWTSLENGRSVFSMASKLMRRYVFQPMVSFYCDAFFPESGVFIEMGCGTAYSSAQLPKRNRTLIGLDFSAVALQAANVHGSMDSLINADIFDVPCESDSLDGIWNLGVMEHFSEVEIHKALREFNRVLKPGGVVVLFWPTERNLSRWLLAPLERVLSWWRRSEFTFFPDEISRLSSKDEAARLMESEGFRVIRTEFNWRSAFIHMAVVAVKE